MDGLYKELTNEIINGFYSVYNSLGFGFLEKVYHNALVLELRSRNLQVESQKQISVYYKGFMVGEYYADLLINNVVIVELKAVDSLLEEHEYQLINYLRATPVEVGLLLNFGRKPEIRRKIFDNSRKKNL